MISKSIFFLMFFTNALTHDLNGLLDELRANQGDPYAQHRRECTEKAKTLTDEFVHIISNGDSQSPQTILERLQVLSDKMSTFEQKCYVAEYEELLEAYTHSLHILQENPATRISKNEHDCADFEGMIRNGFKYRYGKELFLERISQAKAIEGVYEQVSIAEYNTIQEPRTVAEAREDVRADCLKSLKSDRKYVKQKCSQCPVLVPLLLQQMAQLEQEINDYKIPPQS